MKLKLISTLAGSAIVLLMSCNSNEKSADNSSATATTTTPGTGQSGVQDDVSAKNVVQVAMGSKDHTTLVTAVKAAELVDVLSNAGPFTVFAPTNAAFDALPKGTVDDLMKPEKKEDLQNILQYHVLLSAMKAESFQDGQTLSMVNGDNITVSVKDGKVTLNNNVHIMASVQASNGIVHIVDGVLLPPAKK